MYLHRAEYLCIPSSGTYIGGRRGAARQGTTREWEGGVHTSWGRTSRQHMGAVESLQSTYLRMYVRRVDAYGTCASPVPDVSDVSRHGSLQEHRL